MIPREACDRCPVCGSQGLPLHLDVPDLMLETPGRWCMVRCRTPQCGMLWLNPRPAPAALAGLYEGYMTHEASPPPQDGAGLKETVRRAIQSRLLGYPAEIGASVRSLAWLVSLLPWYRASALRDLFGLPVSARGRLLDIGCGNGAPMQRFVAAGWSAVGIDFDAEAVAAAHRAGLDARVGGLKEHAFADAEFDLVLMSHVIEHLADPRDVLAECRRILKPSGSVVIATPNANGLGHRVFGRHWLGLEIPRHLQVFTPAALTRLLETAGFRPVEVRTDAVASANWMVVSRWRRIAEAAGRRAAASSAGARVPPDLLALARIEAVGVALGAAWGDEIVGRYMPV
jgi:2-polyprenyl-3-methyl-5-hydroxy-6-metoxy-1,4-benzoquinol methylase